MLTIGHLLGVPAETRRRCVQVLALLCTAEADQASSGVLHVDRVRLSAVNISGHSCERRAHRMSQTLVQCLYRPGRRTGHQPVQGTCRRTSGTSAECALGHTSAKVAFLMT
jgi:hypothetical protein